MPGSACLVRGRSGARPDGRQTIGKIGYPFAIAKIANNPLMFGNLGNWF